ncbi:DUF6471 domain-containing protein [Aromatoleum tolulyticum]|uniref:DUF6471 domain-containing protein n=1 Tax=Aromatoleum tolulyticum TaxID=34027 RepID=UPI001BAEE702|nr:DUF6471 domain-containing protein [Aromatoleum tolulyticum]
MADRSDEGQSAPYWAHEAKGILRAELDRRGVTYARLAKLMQVQGFGETTRSLANKISRGSFSFVFFLQVMRVLGVRTVSVEPTEKAAGVRYSGQPDVLDRASAGSKKA